MTETEWFACTDPKLMLDFLKGRASDRKLRLFAVACCRRFCHMLVPETLEALSIAEQFAEGLATENERKAAREKAFHARWGGDQFRHRRGPAKCGVTCSLARRAYDGAVGAAHTARHIGLLSTDWNSSEMETTEWEGVLRVVDWSRGKREQCILQAVMIRDLFGPPLFRTVLDPALLTPAIISLAQTIYDERAFERMPELADTLEAAGCTDNEVLEHCQGPGPHVRGCWVVDLLLGKM